jgi:cell division protein FtsB
MGFVVWLSFFDRNDFITTWSYRQKLEQLRTEKAYYEEEIRKNEASLHDLMTNHANLEKYAREEYFMKKENEELFVIVQEDGKE